MALNIHLCGVVTGCVDYGYTITMTPINVRKNLPGIVSRTAIQDPNIRPRNKQRLFWIFDQGEYEGEEGFWVEDEENGEEVFMPLDDEEAFWAVDEHECFALRRVPGRRLRGRRKGGSKG